MKILPLIKLQPTENETENSNRSWFPGRSHQQKNKKTKKRKGGKRGGGRHSVLYNLGLPSTNTVEGRASWKFFVRHLQRQRKAERRGNLALLSLKTTEGRASWKFLVCHLQRQGKEERPGNSQFASYKDKGRQSVLENLGLPPTKTTQGRASWKFSVCHLQRRGKTEGPGRFSFATEKKTGAERKGSSGLTTKKGKPRRNMILKGLRSTTDRKWPWEYLGMSKVAIFKRGSVYRD